MEKKLNNVYLLIRHLKLSIEDINKLSEFEVNCMVTEIIKKIK